MNPIIRKRVMETLGTTTLNRSDFFKITELSLNNLNLTDVADLSEFKNLTKLSLNDNYLKDLTPLDSGKYYFDIQKSKDDNGLQVKRFYSFFYRSLRL